MIFASKCNNCVTLESIARMHTEQTYYEPRRQLPTSGSSQGAILWQRTALRTIVSNNDPRQRGRRERSRVISPRRPWAYPLLGGYILMRSRDEEDTVHYRTQRAHKCPTNTKQFTYINIKLHEPDNCKITGRPCLALCFIFVPFEKAKELRLLLADLFPMIKPSWSVLIMTVKQWR